MPVNNASSKPVNSIYPDYTGNLKTLNNREPGIISLLTISEIEKFILAQKF